jgi:hypothetical protein
LNRHIPSSQIVQDIDSIRRLLGTTKASLWPGFESTGVLVTGLSVGDLIPSETSAAAEALEDDFSPLLHPGGIHSYHIHPTGDHHFSGIDSGNYSFTDNSDDDEAFSVGAFIWPQAIASNAIMGKYDSAGNKEEWRFWIDAAGKLDLELHDASASATEIGVSDAALTLGVPGLAIATYDGAQATPAVNLYFNDTLLNASSATTETGSYVGMENTTAPLTVGCGGVSATPTTEFHGRMALPFITGKVLNATERTSLFNIYRSLLGF